MKRMISLAMTLLILAGCSGQGSYDEGYSVGKSEGYDKGYEDGYAAGYDTGKEDGYQAGYGDGCLESLAEASEAADAPAITPASSAADPGTDTAVVYITKSGTKYHRSGCSYLSKSAVEILLEEAKAKGYAPCSRCNPPN